MYYIRLLSVHGHDDRARKEGTMTFAEYKQALIKNNIDATEKQLALLAKLDRSDAFAKTHPEYYEVRLAIRIENGLTKKEVSRSISALIDAANLGRMTALAALYS